MEKKLLVFLITGSSLFSIMNKLAQSVETGDADSDQEGDPEQLLDEWLGELDNLTGVFLDPDGIRSETWILAPWMDKINQIWIMKAMMKRILYRRFENSSIGGRVDPYRLLSSDRKILSAEVQANVSKNTTKHKNMIEREVMQREKLAYHRKKSKRHIQTHRILKAARKRKQKRRRNRYLLEKETTHKNASERSKRNTKEKEEETNKITNVYLREKTKKSKAINDPEMQPGEIIFDTKQMELRKMRANELRKFYIERTNVHNPVQTLTRQISETLNEIIAQVTIQRDCGKGK
ncbi:hypothetical protein FQA39_LY03765 [Lamprigera yunnana]|nr:hypothetical protein FQA39_LY03765 [Lamprigera yunnana]